MNYLFEIISGFLCGFIDSIAGGGGLISLPALTIVVGPGVEAIATNKIVGTVAALGAFLTYVRAGKRFDFKLGLRFAAFVGTGSFLGSRGAQLVPPGAFPIFLAVTAPVILWMIWRKELWISKGDAVEKVQAPSAWKIPRELIAGLLIGFYDGIWGPGGGTFMLLGLLFAVRMELLAAMIVGRFVNFVSAFVSLLSYQSMGQIHWDVGLTMAGGTVVGAYLGARMASRQAQKVVRPALAVVVLLLVLKVLLIPE